MSWTFLRSLLRPSHPAALPEQPELAIEELEIRLAPSATSLTHLAGLNDLPGVLFDAGLGTSAGHHAVTKPRNQNAAASGPAATSATPVVGSTINSTPGTPVAAAAPKTTNTAPVSTASAASASPTTGGTATISLGASSSTTPAEPLGGNIDGVNYWSMSNEFVDLVKQASPFYALNGNMSNPTNATLNANGWPTQDFYVVLQSTDYNTAHIYNGTYNFQFTGKATVSALNPGVVQNVSYNASTNITTGQVVINASDSDSYNFVLEFSNTNSGVQNLQVLRPGYSLGTTQIFTTQFLNEIQQFSNIRFMDFEQTNNNPVVNWSDRTLPTSPQQSGSHGAAWEYAVDLANETGKDMWINIPFGATDDYVKQLATLLKNNLNPNIHVYVEYSNELWNGAFSQTQANLQAAIGESSTLALPGESQGTYQWDWAARRVGQRTVQISQDFASVYGQSAINNTIRPVLPGQFANPYWTEDGLNFISSHYGSPSTYIYGLASAPYFYLGNDQNSGSLTVDQGIADIEQSVASDEQQMPAWASLSSQYNVKMLSYEGGPDTSGSGSVSVKSQINLDPRMEGIVSGFLTSWYNAGGSLFNWYYAGASDYNSQYGAWGLTNDPTNLDTPKYRGINDVLYGSPTPPPPSPNPPPPIAPGTGAFFTDGNNELWIAQNGGFTALGAYAKVFSAGVDAQGSPECWFLDGNNQLWRYDNGNLTNTGGYAMKIAAGQGFVAFADGNNQLWTYTDGAGFAKTAGFASRFTVGYDASGNNQIVFADGNNQLWTYNQSSKAFTNTGAFANQFVAGQDASGNNEIWFTDGTNRIWSLDQGTFTQTSGFANTITGSGNGQLFFTDGMNEIWVLNSSGTFANTGGFAEVIASGPGTNALFFADGSNQLWEYADGDFVATGAYASRFSTF